MSQTKHEILALLAEAGTEPRHRFGQNFMIDQNLVRIVAEAGNIKPGDLVIEVGPGTGTLTDELLARVAPTGHVVAVEIDRDLAGLLRVRFAGRSDFTLIEGDALAGKHELNPELLVILRRGTHWSSPTTAQRPAPSLGTALKMAKELPPSLGTPGEGGGGGERVTAPDEDLPRGAEGGEKTEAPLLLRAHDKHASAFHPERSEGSLASEAQEQASSRPPPPPSPGVPREGVVSPDSHVASARVAPVKLVANLPYNIASPLVIELLIAGVDLLAFTVQKEVADRLRAVAGSEDYGPLTVMAQLLLRVQVLRTLPPQAFWPSPKIDSALVCLVRDDRLGPEANAFGTFVHKVFSFRRKTLRKALAMSGLDSAALLAATGFDGQLRPEAFTPEQLLQLYFAAAQRRDAPLLSRAIIEGTSSPAISSSTASQK